MGLGRWYATGVKGLDKNLTRSNACYSQAAKCGAAEGMNGLAWLLSEFYMHGHAGMTKDVSEAFKLRKKLYDNGQLNWSQGLMKLALMFANGEGTAADTEQAKQIMRQIVQKGESAAETEQARDWLAQLALHQARDWLA